MMDAYLHQYRLLTIPDDLDDMSGYNKMCLETTSMPRGRGIEDVIVASIRDSGKLLVNMRATKKPTLALP
jgi:hypothetical protein